MTTIQTNLLSPLATFLPDTPGDDVLTAEQWTSLLAIAETVIPHISRAGNSAAKGQLNLTESEYDDLVKDLKKGIENPPTDSLIVDFLGEGATTYKAFQKELQRTLSVSISADARKGIAFILNSMSTRVGSLIFTGSTVPFHEYSLRERTAIFESWSQSYLAPLRQAYSAFSRLFKSHWTRTSPSIGPLLGFPRNPVHGKPGKGFDFEFINFTSGSTVETLECDVVIVGSGCGAGVAAKNLAEAGHRVMVVDKGHYYPPDYLPMTELHASQLLYESGGLLPSDDSSISVMAGSSWGGGGTVNWSASLQTQGYVRKEWADEGLTFFTSAEYQACLDRVCDRMGASTKHIVHNHGNQILLEGARRLGYSAREVPQNTGGTQHSCGYCTLGCGSAEKQGPVISWLPDAARAGARFIEGYNVKHVIFDDDGSEDERCAVGVKGIWKSRDGQITREVVVRAKKVMLSAGTIWSPLILQNSGLKNPQIGRNLKLHPVTFVYGVWPKEIRPWEGSILTSVCNEFEDLDGQGHGVKLECLVMIPSWNLPILPGIGLSLKKLAIKFKQMNGFISLTRDKDSGRVYAASNGRPRIAYTPSATDKAHSMEGLMALAKILYLGGAEEIYVTNDTEPYIRSAHPQEPNAEDYDVGTNHPPFQAWLAKIRAAGLNVPGTVFGSAHQMGTCRMGVSEKTSVVDQRGRVWGTRNLYVADASVFPSASGVNPMITNMAISDWISRGLAREMRTGKI